MKSGQIFSAAILALLVSWAPAHAEDQPLSRISLEDLLATEVTSVAKKPQRVEDAAAAVFAIGQEDIRRSSATNIPDLLRMAPGLEVAALPGGGAAVSARGFNGLSANKLLVLVDGREVYISSFSGVFWDQQLLPVEDIQRIEVVRGPGATLWGANAVNGVINIVSKHAVDTLGAFAASQAASDGSYRVDARYGAQLGGTGALRFYANGVRRDDLVEAGGAQFRDHAESAQGGVRMDLEPTAIDAVTLQGDVGGGERRYPTAYAASPGLFPVASGSSFRSADVLGRWARTWSKSNALSVQAYWDHVQRSESGLVGHADQFDLELAHHFDVTPGDAVIWGLQYRHIDDDIAPIAFMGLTPRSARRSWYGAYVENDLALWRDTLRISVGGKFEHNDVTGFEFQPSVRALWRSPWNWAVWGAVSRAVRTPSRFESALTITTPVLHLATNSLEAEVLTAYELGWRGQLAPGAALDLTAYRTVYQGLIADAVTGFATPVGPPVVQLGNRTQGRGVGAEAALDLKLAPTWTVKAAASWQDLQVDPVRGYVAVTGVAVDPGASPKAQVSVRSQWNVSDSLDADLWYRHVSPLRSGPIPGYDALDARFAWRPNPHLEVSLTGQNLLQARRTEFALPVLPYREVVERRVQFGLNVRY